MMNERKKKIAIIVLLVLLLVGAVYTIITMVGASQEEEQEVAKAPDFTVYDEEGNEVHLSDYVGKPVVLNFWASWCGPCKSEMPDFQETYEEMGEEDSAVWELMYFGKAGADK